MKAVKAALAALIAVALLSCPALAIDLAPGTGDDFYVRDTANVLSSQTKSLIVQYNAALEAQCDGAQLVVVTVNYLDEDTQLASLQLLNDWGVGSAGESNGMLLLLVANEYRGWLSTGDGIDEVFTESVVDDYLDDYFWDYINNDEFDEGVQTLAAELYDWYLDYYDVADSGAAVGNSYDHNDYRYEGGGYYPPSEYERGVDFMGIVSLIVLVAVLWLIISAGRYSRMRGWGYGGGFWPIFWFGGPRIYRDWYHRHPGPRPPRGPGGPGGFGGPGPGPGPGGPRGGRPRGGGGFGGFGGGSGGFGGGFGGGHGGGFGGHGGGGGGGRH